MVGVEKWCIRNHMYVYVPYFQAVFIPLEMYKAKLQLYSCIQAVVRILYHESKRNVLTSIGPHISCFCDVTNLKIGLLLTIFSQ